MDPLLSLINEIREANGQEPVKTAASETRWREDFGFDSFSMAELSACVEREFGVDAFAEGVPANYGELSQRISSATNHE